jgi:hypothetical protein
MRRTITIGAWHLMLCGRLGRVSPGGSGGDVSYPSRRQSTPTQNAMPTRIAGMTIPGRSIVSHQQGSVMAVTPRPYLGEKQRKECELVHNPLGINHQRGFRESLRVVCLRARQVAASPQNESTARAESGRACDNGDIDGRQESKAADSFEWSGLAPARPDRRGGGHV